MNANSETAASAVPAGEAPLGALACPEPNARPDLWPTTARRTDSGELEIGGRPVSAILEQAPAPVYVMDEADFRGRAATWAATMAEEFWEGLRPEGGQRLLRRQGLPHHPGGPHCPGGGPGH